MTGRSLTTVSGWEVTPVTLATASLLTTATSSLQWTGTMTGLLSVVPVLQLTVGAGGSTGDTFRLIDFFYHRMLFSVALKPILTGSTSLTRQTMATTEGSYGSSGWATTLWRRPR